MQSFVPRAARWPRALILAALGACTDDPVAPKTAPTAKAAVQGLDPLVVTVTNTSGGTDVGSLRWAASQISWGGGAIVIDSALGGKTIALDSTLWLKFPTGIQGPRTGITISGKDQFQVMYASAPLYLENLTLSKGNAPIGSAVEARELDMYHTTVTDNRGADGAIFVLSRGSIVNSTVSGNTTSRGAVMYSKGSDLRIANSTIAYNAQGGIGVYQLSGPSIYNRVILDNSIISNNGTQNCATYHQLEYVGRNIVDDYSCADAAITPSNPQLLPLAYNGGPNMTHAIPHTSPAYNAGVDCSFVYDGDQRYVARDAKCDVGAFEFNDFTKVTITIDPTVKADAATGQAVLTGTIKCSRPDYFSLALELHQDQKVGKQVVDVHSADNFPLAECTPSGGRWSTHMPLAPGEAFQTGAARATAATFQTGEWVTPASVASAVKISIARK